MKQITQTEYINLIKEKQENAINALKFVSQQLTTKEGMFEKALKEEKNKAYIEAYEDLICYTNSVEIVPEVKQEDLNKLSRLPYKELEQKLIIEPFKEAMEKIDQNKTPITPYIEPKVEPLRNDRFKEFETIEKGYSRKILIDATSVVFIRFYDHKEHFEIEIWCNCGYAEEIRFIEEARAIAYYNELVEWWKYWEQM